MKFRYIPSEKLYYIYCGASALFITLVYTMNNIYYINVAKLNPLELVLVGTVLEVTGFLFEIPTGIVADTISRRLSIIIGAFLMGLGFMLQGLIPSFLFILVTQVIWGIGYTFRSGADAAWIADEIGEEKLPPAFLKGAQISQIFTLGGIFISTALATIQVSLPIIIGGAMFIFLGFFLIMFMPEHHFTPIFTEEKNPFKKMLYTFQSGFQYIKKSHLLIIIFLVAAFEGLYSEGFERLWTVRFLKELHFPSIGVNYIIWFSIINSVAMVLSILTIEIIKRRFEKCGKITMIWLLAGLNAILASSIVIFALAGNFFLALAAYWSSFIMRTANEPIYDGWINQNIEASEVRATILSTKSQINAIGQIAGGPAIGIIAMKMSVGVGIVVAGILVAPVVFLYLYILSKMRHQLVGNSIHLELEVSSDGE